MESMGLEDKVEENLSENRIKRHRYKNTREKNSHKRDLWGKSYIQLIRIAEKGKMKTMKIRKL